MEVVPDLAGGLYIRDVAEKEQIAETIRESLLAVARLHVREVAFSTDDHGSGFREERYHLSSEKWIQFGHRQNEADLYLIMSESIGEALQLPGHARLIAHAQFRPDWHG